jgi:predicted esterase
LTLCHLRLCGAFCFAAEPDRYDLGRRLVDLERAWADQPDLAARRRALPVLKDALPQLLGGKGAGAAATLDRSRLLLRSAEPTPAERWAASLAIHPERRLLDPAAGPLDVGVLTAYDAGRVPTATSIRLNVETDGGARLAATDIPVSQLPALSRFDPAKWPDGDHVLRAEVVVGGSVVARYAVGVSVVRRLRERFDHLRPTTAENSIDAATLRSLFTLLGWTARGVTQEMDYPAARLFTEAESLAKAIENGNPFYGPDRTGQFWLSVPVGTEPALVRVFVPEQAKAGKPVPLVVALHGAGGSENLFFEAYGNGLVAKLAKERGWMIVAPRSGGLFDAAPPVPSIIDELAKRYPIDPRRVFLVGHSMGAMQAVALAQQSPGKYAAIAALGGGGAVTRPEAFKSLPVFVGCGREDFLLGGAKGLVAALQKAGDGQVTFKEYPDCEHIMIVQEALRDVFNFFDRAASGR